MILMPLGLVVKLYEDKFGDAVVDRVSELQAETQRTRRETGGVSWSCQKVASKMSIRALELHWRRRVRTFVHKDV